MKAIKFVVGVLLVVTVAGGGTLFYLRGQQPEAFNRVMSTLGLGEGIEVVGTDPIPSPTNSVIVFDPELVVNEPLEPTTFDFSQLSDDQIKRIQSGELSMEALLEESENLVGEFVEGIVESFVEEIEPVISSVPPDETESVDRSFAGYTDIDWGTPDIEVGSDLTQGGSNSTSGLSGLDSYITGSVADLDNLNVSDGSSLGTPNDGNDYSDNSDLGLGYTTDLGVPEEDFSSGSGDESYNSGSGGNGLPVNTINNYSEVEPISEANTVAAVATPRTADMSNYVEIIPIFLLILSVVGGILWKRRG